MSGGAAGASEGTPRGQMGWRQCVAASRAAAAGVMSLRRAVDAELRARGGVAHDEAEGRAELRRALPLQLRRTQERDYAERQLVELLTALSPGVDALLSTAAVTLHADFTLERAHGACSLWPSLVRGGAASLDENAPAWTLRYAPGIVLDAVEQLFLQEGVAAEWDIRCDGVLRVAATLRPRPGPLPPPPHCPLIVWALRRACPGYARLTNLEKLLRRVPRDAADTLRRELAEPHWDGTSVRSALREGEWEEGAMAADLLHELAGWLLPWHAEPTLGQYLRGERHADLSGILHGADRSAEAAAPPGRPRRMAAWQVLPDEAKVRQLAETKGDSDCKKQAALVAARAGQVVHPDFEGPHQHPLYGGRSWLKLRFDDGQILFTAWEAVIPPLCDPHSVSFPASTASSPARSPVTAGSPRALAGVAPPARSHTQ